MRGRAVASITMSTPMAPQSASPGSFADNIVVVGFYDPKLHGCVLNSCGVESPNMDVIRIVEFVDRLAHCKYPNCVHIHEDGCAILDAVEKEEIDPSRYESYMELFMERSENTRK